MPPIHGANPVAGQHKDSQPCDIESSLAIDAMFRPPAGLKGPPFEIIYIPLLLPPLLSSSFFLSAFMFGTPLSTVSCLPPPSTTSRSSAFNNITVGKYYRSFHSLSDVNITAGICVRSLFTVVHKGTAWIPTGSSSIAVATSTVRSSLCW